MQHIVTKFVIKFLAFAYLIFAWKYELFLFSKCKKARKEIINKIRLIDKLIKVSKDTPRPKRENPIASQRFFDEAKGPSQPQIIPPKKATITPPYIANAWIEYNAMVKLKTHGIKAKKTNKDKPQ